MVGIPPKSQFDLLHQNFLRVTYTEDIRTLFHLLVKASSHLYWLLSNCRGNRFALTLACNYSAASTPKTTVTLSSWLVRNQQQ